MAAIKTEMLSSHATDVGGGGGSGAVGGGGEGNGQSCSTTNSSNAASTSNGDATTTTATISGSSTNNNTISAAADSSDNQPSTPQPPNNNNSTLGLGNEQHQQQQQSVASSGANLLHPPYGGTHHMYSPAVTTGNASATLPHMYPGIYATASGVTQQDLQQQQHAAGGYASYLNSYEQFYQQQQQQQPPSGNNIHDYGNSGALMYGVNGNGDYKSPSGGIRYHPYLQTPTSCGPNANDGTDGGADVNASAALPQPNSSATVSTTTTNNAMSPRVVSSSSPTSTSAPQHLQLGSGNNNSLSPGSCKLQCKKCGLMCVSEGELQEHITNVHGASPYGSSGYSSSPYIKEELSSGSQQQQSTQQQGGGNPGELLDLDSQKMVYPPPPGSIQSLLNQPHQHAHSQQLHDSVDPLHSMHSMQQRALPGWDQQASQSLQEGLPSYMAQHQSQPQQTDIKPTHQSPYYSPKQSPYHIPSGVGGNGLATSGGATIKQEYPLIKSEYADSQNYMDKSFDPTSVSGEMCQQQPPPSVQQPQPTTQQMMPVSSSPAEFPSTTTGGPQEQQQQYRGFEPPTSSSVLGTTTSITAKAATWKSNEARRPKTYNCTACNKWFTSSGHLKRHYNTTLHKNAVKSSGQPDPATLPISAHHHPARDASVTKQSRRSNANAAAAAAAAAQQQQQQQSETVDQSRGSPDFTQPPGMGQMSQYSASPSPTQQPLVNGLSYSQTANGYQQSSQQQYMQQVQSSTQGMPTGASSNSQTVPNGHPNGVAGPSALTTITTSPPMPSSHTRGLLNTTPTTPTITKIEPTEEEDTHHMFITQSPVRASLLTPEESDQEGSVSALSPMDMEMELLHRQQQRQLEEEAEAAAAVAAEQRQEQEQRIQRRQRAELVEQEQVELAAASYHQQLEEQRHQQARSHNNSKVMPTTSRPNMRAPSPLIISHQQYPEQLQQQPQQVMEDNIFSHTQLPAPQQVHMQQQPQPPVSIMDPQYSIIPLGISTPQLLSNSMQLLQQPLPTTTSIATTTNMDSIHMLPHSHHQLHHPEQQHQAALPSMPNTLLSNTNIQSQLGTISTTITPQPLQHTTTTTTAQLLQPLPQPPPQLTTNTIPCYQQLQPVSELAPLDHTMTYHTIIGNGVNGHSNNGNSGELLQIATLDSYGNLQPHQMLTTANGQILQFLPSGTTFMGQPLFSLPAARSPQEGDLPPAHSIMPGHGHDTQTNHQAQTQAIVNLPSYSANVTSSTLMEEYATLMAETNNLKAQLHMSRSMATMSNAAPDTDPSSTVSSTASFKKRRRAVTNSNGNSDDNGNGGVKRKREPDSNNKSNGANIGRTITMPRTETLPTGRIKCLECNKEFTKNCYLTQHNKSFHSGEYPFRCQKCGKRFQDEDIYTTHLGRHKTQDKPHKCEHCPKQFHHKTDLRRHVDGIHTGFKQHICDICEKSFCRKDHLRKHIETHSRPRLQPKRHKAPAASDVSSQTQMCAGLMSGDTDIKDEKQEALTPQSRPKIISVTVAKGPQQISPSNLQHHFKMEVDALDDLENQSMFLPSDGNDMSAIAPVEASATTIVFETDDDYARQIENVHDDNVVEYETINAETGVNECDIDGGDSEEFLMICETEPHHVGSDAVEPTKELCAYF